jgi:hypothetical protein
MNTKRPQKQKVTTLKFDLVEVLEGPWARFRALIPLATDTESARLALAVGLASLGHYSQDELQSVAGILVPVGVTVETRNGSAVTSKDSDE